MPDFFKFFESIEVENPNPEDLNKTNYNAVVCELDTIFNKFNKDGNIYPKRLHDLYHFYCNLKTFKYRNEYGPQTININKYYCFEDVNIIMQRVFTELLDTVYKYDKIETTINVVNTLDTSIIPTSVYNLYINYGDNTLDVILKSLRFQLYIFSVYYIIGFTGSFLCHIYRRFSC